MTAGPAPRGLALRLAGVTRRFGPVTALAGVDLEIPAGQSLALLGANGAGKSTLLRIVGGLVRPTAGRVEAGPGFAWTPGSTAFRAAIGYLGHRSLLHDYLTARENLVLYAGLYGLGGAEAEERAERWLERVGLARAAERPVRGFSRGMMQRLALARALVHDPALLLLDEPSSGLDTEGRARLDETLRAQREAGTTLLHVSHHAAAAVTLADRVVVLRRGAVVADAPAAERPPDAWVDHAAALAKGAA